MGGVFKGIKQKLTFTFLLVCFIPLAISFVYTNYHATRVLEETAIHRLEYEVSSKADNIEKILDVMYQDILLIGDFPSLNELLERDETRDAAGFELYRKRAGEAIMAFSTTHPDYFQIRYIDEKGWEIIRVDSDGKQSFITPVSGLQFKGDRYYFTESIGYSRGEHYVSKMDFNIEKGAVEFPQKPVIRVATPVFDGKNRKKGIIIINLYGARIIRRLNTMSMAIGGKTFVVDNNGLYVSLLNSERGVSSPAPGANSAGKLDAEYPREVAGRMLSGIPGTVKTENDITSYAPILTRDSRSGEYWVLALVYPQKNIFSSIIELNRVFIVIGALMLLLSAALGVVVAGYFTDPIIKLRDGVESVSRGDYDQRLDITSGDEIESLSNSFNMMAENLKTSIEALLRRSHEMEDALSRATDLLQSIATPPNLIPFFTFSPACHFIKTTGGGDGLRWLEFRSRYAALYLHDVAGHDIHAILLNILGLALADVHKIYPDKKSVSLPSVFMTKMNRDLGRFCAGTPGFVTAVYCLMDFEQREIKIALAGHPAPILINPDGSAEKVGIYGLFMGQYPVSLLDKERYADTVFRLKQGEMLLLFTDGLMEQADPSGAPFEKKFNESIVAKLAGLEPDEAYRVLEEEFLEHLSGRQPDDDVSFIFIGSRAADKYETIEIVPGQGLLAGLVKHPKANQGNIMIGEPAHGNTGYGVYHEPGFTVVNEASEACAPIISRLIDGGWPKREVQNVQLAMEEMIQNAVLHGNLLSARSSVTLTYIVDNDLLEILVRDQGSGFGADSIPQTIEEEDILKESGRGHHMINAYAERVYFNETGNKCWAIFKKTGRVHNRELIHTSSTQT
jgi:anti-sigma regulatory factor (Ser/Thr protein kinase)/HAMP domain-containing protein